VQIRDYQFWKMCNGFRQCVASVLRQHDVISTTFQRQLQRPSVLKVVVDEQYSGHHAKWSKKQYPYFASGVPMRGRDSLAVQAGPKVLAPQRHSPHDAG
jgi:hypothetical protein